MSTLILPVTGRDHIQGRLDGGLVLLEFGDYQCPHCKAASPVIRAIQAELGDQLCYAYRHFPMIETHPDAEAAAETAEAAGAQGLFWEMHNMLFQNSPELTTSELILYGEEVGAEMERFLTEMRTRWHLTRVREDIASGTRSGVRRVPAFFINGIRHAGEYDAASLLDALRVAQ